MSKKKPSVGELLINGAKEMVAFEQGTPRGTYRIHTYVRTAADGNVPAAPAYSYRRVAKLRARMRLSQPLFAQALNVSPETVRAWEQGKRRPEGAALRLLQLTEQEPALLLSMVKETPAKRYTAREPKG